MRSTRIRICPSATFFSPQMSRRLDWSQIQESAVTDRRLTLNRGFVLEDHHRRPRGRLLLRYISRCKVTTRPCSRVQFPADAFVILFR